MYKDKNQPISQRVEDLISEMALIAQVLRNAN